jgi:hypothetical protein
VGSGFLNIYFGSVPLRRAILQDRLLKSDVLVGERKRMKMDIIAGVIALGLAVALMWRNPPLTPSFYRFACLLGFLGLVATTLHGESETFFMVNSLWSMLAIMPLILMPLIPFVLLTEVGFAGFRGFHGSFIRYFFLALSFLGAVGIVASIVIPRILRR